MKLLFDENLSKNLIEILRSEFPDSSSVQAVGKPPISDEAVWRFARDHSYTIVSKDADFQQLAYLKGFPPKVIWLRCGNSTTSDIAKILHSNQQTIAEFERDKVSALLVLP